MLNRIFQNPITSWGGVAILTVGGLLLFFGKITFNEFLMFLAACGLGLGLKDPQKGSLR